MNEILQAAYFENDYQRPIAPYKCYMNALEEVFTFENIGSFADLGCNNGRLIEAVKRKYLHTVVTGIDYFAWSKEHADALVKDAIIIGDLGEPFQFQRQYDFVNCSEVGEHIVRESEDILLDNITACTADMLCLTWSDTGGDEHGQHVNPRPERYIIKKLEERDFLFCSEISDLLRTSLKTTLKGQGFHWWAESIMVFKRQAHIRIHPRYVMQGTHTDNSSHKRTLIQAGPKTSCLQKSYMDMTRIISNSVVQRKPLSILRAGDGDFFFLREFATGSATPGRRALTRPYADMPMARYRYLFWKNSIITFGVEPRDQQFWLSAILFFFMLDRIKSTIPRKIVCKLLMTIYKLPLMLQYLCVLGFVSVFRSRIADTVMPMVQQIVKHQYIPLEVIYGLVANQWIFRAYPRQIGIVASGPKLNIIKKLLAYDEYRAYLGIETFVDFIEVPQIGAADDLDGLAEIVGAQMRASKAALFLLGVGSVKTGLLPLLNTQCDQVLLDVGCGIDAIAGIVCQDRPYFADWINFRMQGYDYSDADFMDKGNPAWDNPAFKTVWLNSLPLNTK